jgi:hypothetical protein
MRVAASGLGIPGSLPAFRAVAKLFEIGKPKQSVGTKRPYRIRETPSPTLSSALFSWSRRTKTQSEMSNCYCHTEQRQICTT